MIMNTRLLKSSPALPEFEEEIQPVGYDFGLKRRAFVQWLGAGLLVAVSAAPGLAQQRRGRGGGGGGGARKGRSAAKADPVRAMAPTDARKS